jgi:hypothetical protein
MVRVGKENNMSRFYGSMQGNRGMATRQGTRASGIDAHVRGWHAGIRASALPTEPKGEKTEVDRFLVSVTGGSNNSGTIAYIADFTEIQIELVKQGKAKIIPAKIELVVNEITK